MNMSSPSPIDAPEHVLKLLSQLHKLSLDQEAALNPSSGKFTSTDPLASEAKIPATERVDLDDIMPASQRADFDDLMRDKFIALDEDKCQFMYQLITATDALNVVEAGTSFGVSTIYLALAIAKNKAISGGNGIVIATEKEPEKAAIARKYWKQCGEAVEKQIDLRLGDLLQTLKHDLPPVDLLLLDIWAALALPTLKTVQPKLRHGAVILTDNTISGREGYKELLAYMRAPGSGFFNITLPYTNGFEMSVYLPSTAPVS